MKYTLMICISLIIAGLFLLNFQGCNQHDQEVAEFAVNTAGMVAGNLVATKNPEIIPIIGKYYADFQKGRLTVAALNAGILELEKRKGLDPLIINRMLALARLIGMDVDGDIVMGWNKVNVRLLRAAVDGFVQGVRLAK